MVMWIVKSLIRHSLFQPVPSILWGPQFYKGGFKLPFKWGRGTPNLMGPLKCHDTGGGTRCHKILKIDQNIVILVTQGTILLGDQNFRTPAAFLPTHIHDRSVLLFIVLDQP